MHKTCIIIILGTLLFYIHLLYTNKIIINFEKYQKKKPYKKDNFYHTFYRQHLNNHELQQLVDSGFQTLDVNPKDGLLEHDELSKLFDMRDTDGKIPQQIFLLHSFIELKGKQPERFFKDHMLTVQKCNKTLQKVSNLLSGQVLHLQLLHNIHEVNSLIQST